MKKIALLLSTALCAVVVPLSAVASAQKVQHGDPTQLAVDSATDQRAVAQERVEERRQAREEKIAEIKSNVDERHIRIIFRHKVHSRSATPNRSCSLP